MSNTDNKSKFIAFFDGDMVCDSAWLTTSTSYLSDLHVGAVSGNRVDVFLDSDQEVTRSQVDRHERVVELQHFAGAGGR